MSNERIDLTQFEEITKGTWEVIDTPYGRIDIGVRQGGGHSPVVTFTESMAKQVRNIPRDVADMNAIAAVPELIAELKRYYGFVDELLNYFHHTILENESFMDLMYRMGVFEFEPEPWQNEKGEWMMFVGDTYETGEWVVDKDFTPNQEE